MVARRERDMLLQGALQEVPVSGNQALMQIVQLLKSAHSIMAYRCHGMNSIEMGQSFRLWLFMFVGTSSTNCVSFEACMSFPIGTGLHQISHSDSGIWVSAMILHYFNRDRVFPPR